MSGDWIFGLSLTNRFPVPQCLFDAESRHNLSVLKSPLIGRGALQAFPIKGYDAIRCIEMNMLSSIEPTV